METGSRPRWQSWEGRGWLGLEGQRPWVTAEKSTAGPAPRGSRGRGPAGRGPGAAWARDHRPPWKDPWGPQHCRGRHQPGWEPEEGALQGSWGSWRETSLLRGPSHLGARGAPVVRSWQRPAQGSASTDPSPRCRAKQDGGWGVVSAGDPSTEADRALRCPPAPSPARAVVRPRWTLCVPSHGVSPPQALASCPSALKPALLSWWAFPSPPVSAPASLPREVLLPCVPEVTSPGLSPPSSHSAQLTR